MSIFPGGGSTTPPDSFITAPQVFYAAPDGNNSTGDGSQFAPFQTINVAVAACQANSGGCVQYAPGTRAHTVNGAGIWLRGNNDTGPGGSGWVNNVNSAMQIRPWLKTGGGFSFGGIGWLPGGNASVFSSSPLWLAGTNGGLTLDNMSMAVPDPNAPTMRMGLGSPLNAYSALTTYAIGDYVQSGGIAYVSIANGNINHTPVSSPGQWTGIRTAIADGLAPTLMAFVRFRDCYWEKLGTDNGPAIDVGAGFWYWFEHCSIARTTAGTNLLTNCAWRQYSDGSGDSYLTYMSDTILSGMGCYVVGGCELNMDRVSGENMNVMGLWYGDPGPTGVSPRGQIALSTLSDSGNGVPIVQNNGTGFVHVIDSDPAAGNIHFDGNLQATSVISVGQAGITGPTAELFTEAGRRLHAPGSCEYKNIAAALQWFNPTYAKGPDGAASGTHTAAVLADQYVMYDEANGYDLPANGDYYAWGVWIKWDSTAPDDSGFVIENNGTGNLAIFSGAPQNSGGVGSKTLGASGAVQWQSPIPSAVERWTYYSGWAKIVSHVAGNSLRIIASPPSPGHVTHAQPWLIHIPAADGKSAGEVAALAMFSRPFPNNGENTTAFTAAPPAPTVGMPALWPGQKLAFWDATLHAWKYITVDNGALVVS